HTHTHTHTNKHTRTRSTTYVCHHPSVCSYHLLLPLLTSFFFLSFLPLSLSLLLFYLNPSNPFALHSTHTHTLTAMSSCSCRHCFGNSLPKHVHVPAPLTLSYHVKPLACTAKSSDRISQHTPD